LVDSPHRLKAELLTSGNLGLEMNLELHDPYREAVAQQSPGSRSAPWVDEPFNLQNPNGVLQNDIVKPRWGFGHGDSFVTQGALRDPGLCCTTALRLRQNEC
jgi:hypothetical protein